MAKSAEQVKLEIIKRILDSDLYHKEEIIKLVVADDEKEKEDDF